MAIVPLVVAVPAAVDGVGFGPTPTFPTNVTVGQTGLPGSIQVVNASTAPENAGDTAIDAFNLVPACGVTAFVGNGNCPVASADPAVFQLSATGTGGATTAGAGQTFTIAIIDTATGQAPSPRPGVRSS